MGRRFESFRGQLTQVIDNQVFAALFGVQLYGLLKLDKHRKYDVWKGEVTYAETEESVASNVPRPKSGLFVVQRNANLSRSLEFARSREELQAIHH